MTLTTHLGVAGVAPIPAFGALGLAIDAGNGVEYRTTALEAVVGLRASN